MASKKNTGVTALNPRSGKQVSTGVSGAEAIRAVSSKKSAPKAKSKSGKVPEADKRLTANISASAHKKLRLAVIETDGKANAGELLELLIDTHLDDIVKGVESGKLKPL